MIYRTYENIETGEQHQEFLKYSEHEQYALDHPELRQVIGAMNVVDPVGIGVTKPPTEFLKNVVGKIKHANPQTSALERRYSIPREW